jgi:thioredoxin reductase
MILDCVVVGGGPAGLSAALMLGRCRRRVVVCDAGEPRNIRSRGIHGYLTRDGVDPTEFLRLARAELTGYGTVELCDVEVTEVDKAGGNFRVICADGSHLMARKLLLATGVQDQLPPIEGLESLYGTSVHHCPYCDAWEWRDHPMAVYGTGEAATDVALGLTAWTPDILLCTDGSPDVERAELARLARFGIKVRTDRVVRLEGRKGYLERVVFAQGPPSECRALFLACPQQQRSPLAARLGCRFNERGAVDTGKCEATNVPGLYVAGDASKEAQFVIVAAAEGTEAGMAIHRSLLQEELRVEGHSRPETGVGGLA